MIISGEPGVGKTTLANQIILYYHTRLDYRMFFYASSMNDLYIANHWDGKKVIFFDDFWGGNDFTQSQTNTNTNDLVRFIEHIQQQKNCILIMTTREYILEQGLKRHADFRRLVECDKLDLRMAQYSEADRLQIYLAHLKASPLTWKQLSSLYQLGTTVMHSPNFNPRVIGEFTKSITPDMDARKCCEDFLHYLDYPLDFWERIFQELSEEARTVYLLMAIMPLPIENDILRECYAETMQIRGKELKWKGFPDVLIELEKTIVRTDLYGPDQRKISTVTFQNPSVKDFILQEIRKKSGKI